MTAKVTAERIRIVCPALVYTELVQRLLITGESVSRNLRR